MRLKSLTLNGFKSFADKTTIEFDHGLTGIVGPNGSGKSNITEAIRWALGEQSAKSLRGERMGDVIFAGTDARPALGRAEVTLTFDNTDEYLRDQPAEVTVTRRLFRDGESDFLINNQAVRLKDVVGMFMDSGLGRESFAFISQGRVEAIFNSKPEDRRGIFEEAAGVLKYKQQKQRAQAQLQETADNLDRVRDIVHELDGRMGPLAEQAAMAQDFAQQEQDYKTKHQQLLALEIQDLVAEQSRTQTEADVTKKTLAALADQIERLEAESDAATQADTELQRQLDNLSDELLTKSMQQEQLNGADNLSSERVQNARTNLADLREQLGQAEQRQALAQEKLAALESAAVDLQAKASKLGEAAAADNDHAREMKTIKADLAKNQADYIAALQAQAEVRNDLAALEKEQQLSASQLTATQGRLSELAAQQATLKEELDAATIRVETAQEQFDHAQSKLTAAQDKVKVATEAVTAAQTAHQTHQGQFNQTQTRYNTLKEMSADYTGFYGGVRAVLKRKSQLKGVLGAVAELLTVPTEYQAAFDQALGGNLQAIVTTDETAAKGAIAYLKQSRAGRATFLPVAVVRPRELPGSVLNLLHDHAGFIGVGSDLATYSADVAPVMKNLMGSLIVMDTLDHAVQAAGVTGHRYRIVTLDGDILNAGGSLSGGSRQKGSASPLARQSQLTQLETQLQAMRQKLQDEEDELTDLIASRNALTLQVTTLQSAVNAATAELAAKQGDARVLTEQGKQLDRQRATLQLSLPAGTVDLADEQRQLTDKATAVTDELAALQEQAEQLKARQDELEASSGAAGEAAAERRAALAVAQTDLKTNAQQQAQWRETATEAAANIKRLTERIAGIENASAVTAEEKNARKATLARLNKEIEALHEQQTTLKQQQATGKTALSQLAGRITTAYTQQQQAMAQSETQSVTLNRCRLNLDNRLSTLAEDYQVTYEAALAAVPTPAPDQPQLRSQIKLLKRGLDELGPVNPHAVTEYAEVKTRYDFLTGQQDDLNEARDQLLGTMAELDDEVRERFSEVFNATSEAFTTIFPEMFGGGHAELRLTQPDDLLNTGIEIIAQPPGKKLTRLSLLSGGERALTAITLLFAILRVRPVPFSVLDEVEASLDEANVDRFGEFLRHYSSATQFIVITHRRGTMVAADVLYGVTMQESGVSTMVAVTLDEAVAAKAAEQPAHPA